LTDIFEEKELEAWKKNSFFSKREPDWEKVRKIGSRIDADFAVLVNINHSTDSRVNFYLYEYKSGEIYSTIDYGITYSDLRGGIQHAMRITMDRFYKTRQK
jgi:hypothetical protein